MPIYAYKCAECSHELEVIRKVSDPPLTECPNCGKPALVKQVTAAGFHLKGGGWYVTDFRDQGAGKKKESAKPDEKAPTDQASESKSDPKSDPKSDTKTDTKTESADSKGAGKSDAKTESKSEPASKPATPASSPPKTGSSGTS